MERANTIPKPIEIILEVAEILDVSVDKAAEITDKFTCMYVNKVWRPDKWTEERTEEDEHQGRGDPSSSCSDHSCSVYDDVPCVSVFENSLQL